VKSQALDPSPLKAPSTSQKTRFSNTSVPLTAFHAPWSIFWAGFVVRVLYITLAHTYRVRPFDDHFSFGWEMGRIARALISGYGYADPFRGHTGPTAWVAPLYPLLMAAIFKGFGVYSLQSAWVLLTLNSLFSALTALAIWEIGARCFDRRVASWAAWLWVFYPAAMQYAVRWIWEMALTTCLFSWVLVLALRMRNIGGIADRGSADLQATMTNRRWAVFGLLWGAIGLTNPSLLIFLPVCGLWLIAGSGNWRRQLRGVGLSVLVFSACLAPWIIRNSRVFGQFVPMRGNFGAEFYLGNGPGATGLLMEYDQPMQAPDQLRLYAQMGEIAYSKMRGRIAMAVVRSDPWHFAGDVLKRVFFFWAAVPHPSDDVPWVEYGRGLNFVFTSVCGLLGLAWALKQRAPAADLFAWAFLLLPLVYYFVTVHARFRHPLEPLIAILGVYLFQSVQPREIRGRKTNAT
jgi:4-amino-4-deoxy-L-arabinose transferase-like glycosyltransferase